MVQAKYKKLIFYLSLFLMVNSSLSIYGKLVKPNSISNLPQSVDSNPGNDGAYYFLKNSDSDNNTIEVNKEGNSTYYIKPKTNYIFILNESLTHFFISQSDDIIIYNSNLDSFPRFCAFDKYKTPIYVNNSKEEEIELEVISLKMKSNVFSGKFDSPSISGIKPMKESQIYIYQLTKDNYFYFDSYDKTSRFFYGEYKNDMSIDDIKNINTKYFKEGSDEIILLKENSIYIGIFLQGFSFPKLYFYDSLPEKIDISNGDKESLYLEKHKNYILDFTNNTMPYIIRLNPKINSILQINESDINVANKYFYPSSSNEEIEVSTGNEDALIEILYSINENKIDIINNTYFSEYITTKDVTLIEYNPPDDSKTNLEIYIESEEDFKFGAYGGLSKDNYFYYSNDYYSDNNFKYYFIRINNPLKNIQLESEEKYYISLEFIKSNPEQKIKISLTNYKNIIETLYEPIEQNYINNVISNLNNILQNYMFLDIIKNPPAPEGHPDYVHKPVHLIETLNSINRNDRKFYDFYQEIRKDLAAPRNLQLRIYGLFSTKNTKISYMTACLPFSFYVDKDSNNKTKLYIKYFDDCAQFFSEEIRNIAREKADNIIALEKINNKDPFEYIQEWGRIYQGLKSPHGHFTLMKTIIHAFYIRLLPYSPEELKMKFKFEDETKTLDLDYYIYMPDTAQMFLEDDFENYFESTVKTYQNKIMEPNIFELIKSYKKEKRLLIEENQKIKTINWDIQSEEEDGIRCRVDNDKHINVLVQESFNIDLNKNVEIAYKCAELFHKNEYRIVVIESLVQGGLGELGLSLRQLLQVKIKNRSYLAFKPINLVKGMYSSFYDSETCSPFKSEERFLCWKRY